jgi:hypothetical protein
MSKLAVVLLLIALSLSADVSGRWKGEAVIDGHPSPLHFTLVQQGNTLKGTGGPTETDQNLLSNTKIEGQKLIFDLAPAATQPLHFELSGDDYTLRGVIKIKRGGQVVSGNVLLRKRTN